jgi:hypothetical protein
MEQGLELAHESGFMWWEANLANSLAEWYLALGRPDDAEAAARRDLGLRLAMNDRFSLVYSLATWAAIAAARGRLPAAGRAWGAADAEQGRRPVPEWEHVLEFSAPMLAGATAEFEQARRIGAGLALEEAAQAALATDDG